MRILLIEDDDLLGQGIRDQIVADGHMIDWAQSLENASDYMKFAAYDLILLDLMLPDGMGLEFLKSMRQKQDTTPVMILTAMDQITDRIKGLDAGADDYLVKPFHLEELSARISAVSRRYTGNPSPYLEFGDLFVNLGDKHIRRAGKDIKLTAREWALAENFFLHPSVLQSKSNLEDKLSNFDRDIQPNTVEVYISRLRKKLGSDRIITERGLGYRFNP